MGGHGARTRGSKASGFPTKTRFGLTDLGATSGVVVVVVVVVVLMFSGGLSLSLVRKRPNIFGRSSTIKLGTT